MKRSIERKKIIARVSASNYARLERIVKIYGFRSVYSLMQYIMYCFLRVADHDHDSVDQELPVEIINTFNVRRDAEKIHAALARVSKRKKGITPSEMDLFESNEDEISRDIHDIFDEAEDEGKEYNHNIRERRER